MLSIKKIKTNLVGDYNLPNVLVAVAVGKYFSVSDKLIVTAETLVEGKNLYTTNCADCHSLYEKESFTAEQWKPIVLRMQKNTKLTDLQREKIYAYLTTPQF